jgi:hypothetical protein
MPEVDDVVRAVLADTPRMTDKSFAAGRERVLTHRRKPRQWLKIAAVAAGVALVASAAVLIQPGDIDTLQAAQSPAAVLDKAAGLVRDPDLAPGQYRYVRAVKTYPATAFASTRCFRPNEILETWIPQDSTADWLRRLSHETGRPDCGSFPGGPAESRGKYASFRGSIPLSLFHLWTDLTPQFLAGLPRDPQAMYSWITQVQTRPDRDFAGLVTSGYLLPADLRATLYRAMKHLPDITVTEQSVTIDGRKGTAVGLLAGAVNMGRQEDLVISTEDGSVIAHRVYDANGDLASTDVFTYGTAGKIGEPPLR